MNLEDEEIQEATETEVQEEVEQETETPAVEEEEPEQLIVQIGDDEPEEQEKAPAWVNDLRKANREKDKRIKELEALANGEQAKPKLGAKPTLESCDYDQTEYERQLEGWYESKRAVDEEERAQREAKERADQAWQSKLKNYEEGKSKLSVPDYEDVEATVLETFNQTQQGIVVQGAENPALLAYALGKNPKRAKELASITDPIEFAFAVAKVEASLKVTNKGAPPPEKKLASGVAGVSGGVDNTLERLEKEAEKTGDRSKVVAYKRQKRQQMA